MSLFSSSPRKLYETRTLTLPSGMQIRVKERLDDAGGGVTNRVFESGEQLFELSVVSDEEHIEAVLAALADEGCRIIRRYGRKGTILRVLVPRQGIKATDVILSRLGAVGAKSAARSPVNFNVPLAISSMPSAVPNDPLFNRQWALEKSGVIEVWKKGFFGYPNVPCAVFDTGCHLTHEDLQGNVHTRVSALNSDPDPEDHHGHGSHCLGIMGADSNNAKGVAGAGQVANLTSIRGPISYWQEGDSILDGFQYALDNGIRIVSCSFGSYGYDAAEEALITDYGKAGGLVVVAAGNDGNDNDRLGTYPAAFDCDNILTVVATNENDEPANLAANGWATSFGALTADIGAPGTDIYSCTKDSDQSYEAWSGTSMATPLVAACAAFVWERNPSWGPLDVKRRLMSTADRLPSLIGLCQSGARINLARALDESIGYVSVEPFAVKVLNVGETLSVEIRSEVVDEIALTLYDRSGIEHGSRRLAVGAGGVTRLDCAMSPEMIGRGWYFKAQGLKNGEAVEDAFAYSMRFRVKDSAHEETIDVRLRSARPLDANRFAISFSVSDAEFVSGAIEGLYADEDGSPVWLEDALIFVDEPVKAGEERTMVVSLQGKGWINGQDYRVLVYDADDPDVRGYSEVFTFDRSNGSVFLLSGEPIDRDNPSAGGTGEWKSEYRVGEEMRLSFRLPTTSLYWLYLVDEERDEIVLLKETWVNILTDGFIDSPWRAFDWTIPDQFVGRKHLYLYFYDAFNTDLHDRSEYFDVLPRADGEVAPPYWEVLGDKSQIEYMTNGQWTPQKVEGEWAMKACWLNPGEEGCFEALVSGPRTIEFDVMNAAPETSHGRFSLAYTSFPVMKDNHWEELAAWAGSVGGWQHVIAQDLPNGNDWVVRWKWTRDKDEKWETNEPSLRFYLRNLRLAEKLDPLKLKIDSKGVATISPMPLYPTNVHWTVNGSEPTEKSRRWRTVLDANFGECGESIGFPRSVILKAKAFASGYEPSDTATIIHFAPEVAEDGALLVSSVADLIAFSQEVSNGNTFEGKILRLKNDIDMKGYDYETPGGESITYYEDTFNDGEYKVWHHSVPFLGAFDGAGHAIHNLRILPHYGVTEDFGSLGFIGMLGKDAKLFNLTLVSPVVDAVGYITVAGTLVGANWGEVSNCTVYDASFLVIGADHANTLVGWTAGKGEGGAGEVVNTQAKSGGAPAFVPSGASSGMEYPDYPAPAAPKPECYFVTGDWAPNYFPDGSEIIMQSPMSDRMQLRVPARGEWEIRYTLDGSEPNEDSTLYEGEFLLPGSCVVKARAFARDYAPSDLSEVKCTLDMSGLTKEERAGFVARLTVKGGRKLSGTYWLEDFSIRADASEPGMRFSHWKVTGPLVLDDYTSPEISFKWWQGDAEVVLEAVYVRPSRLKVIFR